MIAYRLSQPDVMVPTIVSLQQRLETVRQGEIDRVRGRLGRLSPEQENAIESLTRGIINKILHPAMTVLTAASTENESTLFVEMVYRIFNLGEKRTSSPSGKVSFERKKNTAFRRRPRAPHPSIGRYKRTYEARAGIRLTSSANGCRLT